MKVNYKSIDIAKLLLAYGVVTVHCLMQSLNHSFVWNVLEHYVLRMTVPIFFLFSGFFLGIKVKKSPEKKKESIIVNIKRLMIHYLFWNAIYGGIAILFDIKQGIELKVVLFRFVRNTLTFNATLMWYLGALIFSYVVLAFVKTKKRLIQTLVLAVLLYIVGLLMGSYSGIFRGTAVEEILQLYYHFFYNSSNGLFVGYVFVGYGFYYGCYAEQEPKKKTLGLIYLLGNAIMTLEVLLVQSLPDPLEGNYDFFFGNVIIAPVVFLWILQCKVKEGVKTEFFRKASSCIYFTHMAILTCINFVIDGPVYLVYVIFLVSITLCAYIVYKWNNKYINMIT